MSEVGLSLLVLKTRQVDKLREVYGTLGINFTQERHGRGPVHYAGRLGDVVFEIYPLPPEDDTFVDSTTRLGFTIGALKKVVKAVEAMGMPILAQPQATKYGLRAIIRDPDGRVVELRQS